MLPMYLRLRPQSNNDPRPWLNVLNSTTIQQADQEHGFHHIFDEDSNQSQVYNECVQPLVEKVLSGQDQCFFTLGATGSGKTWTTVGTPSDPGVVYSAVAAILNQQHSGMATISMLEVYNDRCFDLLDGRKPLILRPSGTRCNVNAHKVGIVDFESAKNLLEAGYAARAVNSTLCNSQSSRSHAILFIEVGGARLTIGDLAGNERVNDAGSVGAQLQEAGEINKSLMLFGQALQSLHQGRLTIKSSKLSALLLVNATQALPVMLITIDPYKNEKPGRQILRYATIARKVKKLAQQPFTAGSALASGATAAEFEARLREKLYQEVDGRLARLAEAVWA